MFDRAIMCNYADGSQNEDWGSHLKLTITSNSGEKPVQIERTWYDENGSIDGSTLNLVVEWKALKKSLRTKERWENVLQSCHPFDIQLYRTLESAVQIALKEVALVFGGFSCLCRKERKEEEESWRHSEKHRAKQSRTKGETFNTDCRSQRPHHKHLLLHPESRQLLAQASKLRFSQSFFFGRTSQTPVVTAVVTGTEQKGCESFKTSASGKQVLKAWSQVRVYTYNMHFLEERKKGPKCVLKEHVQQKEHSTPRVSSYLLFSSLESFRYESMHVEPRLRQARVYRHVSSRPFRAKTAFI